MIRGILTLVALALMILLVGFPLMLLSVVLPTRWTFDRPSVWWSWVALAGCGAKVETTGLDRVDVTRPAFFVSNHQSALDIPILLYVLGGRGRFFAKKDLFKIPVFGRLLRKNGFIPLERNNPRVDRERIGDMLSDLSSNPSTFIVFPEGTRSTDGHLLPFHRGTMKILQRAGMPVVPVAIDGSFKVHRSGQYRARPGRVKVHLLDPISADEVGGMTTATLHDRLVATIAGALENTSAPPARRAGTTAMQDSTAVLGDGGTSPSPQPGGP